MVMCVMCVQCAFTPFTRRCVCVCYAQIRNTPLCNCSHLVWHDSPKGYFFYYYRRHCRPLLLVAVAVIFINILLFSVEVSPRMHGEISSAIADSAKRQPPKTYYKSSSRIQRSMRIEKSMATHKQGIVHSPIHSG